MMATCVRGHCHHILNTNNILLYSGVSIPLDDIIMYRVPSISAPFLEVRSLSFYSPIGYIRRAPLPPTYPARPHVNMKPTSFHPLRTLLSNPFSLLSSLFPSHFPSLHFPSSSPISLLHSFLLPYVSLPSTGYQRHCRYNVLEFHIAVVNFLSVLIIINFDFSPVFNQNFMGLVEHLSFCAKILL